MASLLEAASGWRPVLLVLDDLHWVAKPTLLLLKYLIRSGPPMRLLVVGTDGDSDIGRGRPLTDLLADLRRQGGVERLRLRSLSDAEALSLMENLAGHELWLPARSRTSATTPPAWKNTTPGGTGPPKGFRSVGRPRGDDLSEPLRVKPHSTRPT